MINIESNLKSKKSFASGQVTFTDSRYGIYGAKCAVGSGQVPCAIVKEGVQNNKEMYDFVDKILKYVWPRCNDIWKTEMNKLLKELKKAAICNGSGGGQFKLYLIIITQVIFDAFLAKINKNCKIQIYQKSIKWLLIVAPK